jgi:hypothetical protein
MTEETETLDGFEPGTRSFYVTGVGLTVQRAWSPVSRFPPERKPEFITSIKGRCSLDTGDHVRVIGTKTLVREFDLHIGPDSNAEEQWRWDLADALAVSKPTDNERLDKLYDHFFKRVVEEGNKHSPTAHLYRLGPDAEFGRSETWDCYVMVPPAVIAALESDLMAGRVESVSVGINWIFTLLANRYSRVTAPNIWGLLPDEAGLLIGASLVGHVSGLSWTPTLGAIAPSIMPQPDEPEKRKRGW